MISHNVNHLKQAIRALTEVERRQGSRPEGWDNGPNIPAHLVDQTVHTLRTNTPAGAPREEVQEDALQSPLSPAATHGRDNSEQANSLVVNIKDIEVDAISIKH